MKTLKIGGYPAVYASWWSRHRTLAAVAAGIALQWGPPALAQTATTLNGPPVQVIPYVAEPGVPLIAINPGTPNPFGGTGGPGGGAGVDGGGTAGGNVGSSDALDTLLGTPFGSQVITNAQAVGVNASALAATCALESGCQNVGGSGAQGVFQMYPAAFQEGLTTALAANPTLASQIVSGDAGRMDPVTEGIAASGYLMQAAQSLQANGIADPTVLQVRSYYNFGPSAGTQIGQADGSNLMSAYLSPTVMQQNGVTPGETVGQWQAAVAAKIGTAASQSVLS